MTIEKDIQVLKKILAADEKNWNAAFALGVALVNNGEREAAREAFERVMEQRPDHELACVAFAEQSIATKRAAEASRVLGRIAEKYQDKDQIVIAYAMCLAHGGDLRRALAVMGIVAKRTTDASFLLDYAEMCIRTGFPELADQVLAKVESLSPGLAPAAHLRGIVAERRGDPALAMQEYRRALEIDRDFVRGKNALALLLMRESEIRDLEEADRILRSIAETRSAPGQAAMANLALLRSIQGDQNEAVRLAEQVLAAGPSNPAVIDQAKRIAEG